MSRLFTAAALVAALLGVPTLASADFGEGAFRLGAGPTLLSVEHLPEPDAQIISYGLLPTALGIHLGYMLTAQLYLGAQFGFGGTALSVSTGPLGRFNTDSLFFTILPRLAYLIALNAALTLYFAAEVGLTITGDPDGNLDEVFRANGIAGLHIFATDSFSIDGELGLGFTHRVDSSNAGFLVSLGLIFSGWLGGRESGAASSSGRSESSDDSSTERAPPPEPVVVDDPEGGMD